MRQYLFYKINLYWRRSGQEIYIDEARNIYYPFHSMTLNFPECLRKSLNELRTYIVSTFELVSLRNNKFSHSYFRSSKHCCWYSSGMLYRWLSRVHCCRDCLETCGPSKWLPVSGGAKSRVGQCFANVDTDFWPKTSKQQQLYGRGIIWMGYKHQAKFQFFV
jgi:hypothetical protein